MTTFYMIGIALAIVIAVVVIAQAVSIVRDIMRERDGWQDAYNEARAMLWDAQQEVRELRDMRDGLHVMIASMKADRACAYCDRERQDIYKTHCDDCFDMFTFP